MELSFYQMKVQNIYINLSQVVTSGPLATGAT